MTASAAGDYHFSLHKGLNQLLHLLSGSPLFITALYKEGANKYLRDPWHIVESVNVSLALLSVVFFALRSYEVVTAVEFMKNNKGKIAAQIRYFIIHTGQQMIKIIKRPLLIGVNQLVDFRPMNALNKLQESQSTT